MFDFFFFKQKTAYEMLRSLVGSEMCIRDRACPRFTPGTRGATSRANTADANVWVHRLSQLNGCLLYTSDAADDLLCVDLGGRRIIKKKISDTYQLYQYTNTDIDTVSILSITIMTDT